MKIKFENSPAVKVLGRKDLRYGKLYRTYSNSTLGLYRITPTKKGTLLGFASGGNIEELAFDSYLFVEVFEKIELIF